MIFSYIFLFQPSNFSTILWGLCYSCKFISRSPRIGDTQIIHFSAIFHCKPSIIGYLNFRNPPCWLPTKPNPCGSNAETCNFEPHHRNPWFIVIVPIPLAIWRDDSGGVFTSDVYFGKPCQQMKSIFWHTPICLKVCSPELIHFDSVITWSNQSCLGVIDRSLWVQELAVAS